MKKNNISLIAALFYTGLALNTWAQDGPKMLRKFEPIKALPATINSEHEESYPLLTPEKDVLYFVRTYKDKTGIHKRGEQDIWFSIKEGNTWSESSNNLPKVNNKFNNAVVGIAKEGDRMFVLNQYPNENYLTAKGVSKTTKEGNNWSKPKTILMPKIEFKGDHYGAYVSPDERVMILSINTNGTLGEEDLWVSLRDDMGRWGDLINLGTKVNSGRAEFAPYLSDDKKTLYFSSLGHKGMGDADIFVVTRLDESWTNWTDPENLGEPINSKGYDGYFFITKDSQVYFTSKRGGQEFSDIYTTRMFWEKVPEPPKVEPVVIDTDMVEIENLKKKFTSLSLIHFKFDKSDIQPLDVPILDEVAAVMNRRERIIVTLKGHTDAIGTNAYNIKLSDRRAKSAKAYLVKKGVPEDRIILEKHGEEKPVAENTTTTGRAENRRVEIIVEVNK